MSAVRLAAIVTLMLAVPAVLLWDRTPRFAPPSMPAAPVIRPVIATPPARRLFGGAVDDPAIADTAAGAPVVAGIVGRLPDAAVALVRDADGRSRSVAIGGTSGGWRLEGLAADSAVFARGAERVRVRLAD